MVRFHTQAVMDQTLATILAICLLEDIWNTPSKLQDVEGGVQGALWRGKVLARYFLQHVITKGLGYVAVQNQKGSNCKFKQLQK